MTLKFNAIVTVTFLIVFGIGLVFLIKTNQEILTLQVRTINLNEGNYFITKALIAYENNLPQEYFTNLKLAKNYVAIADDVKPLQLFYIIEANHTVTKKIKARILSKQFVKNSLTVSLFIILSTALIYILLKFRLAYLVRGRDAKEQKRIYEATSHELGGLIQGIIFAADTFKNTTAPREIRAYKYISAATARMSRVTETMLLLGRHKPPEMREVDLNSLIREAIEGRTLVNQGIVITHFPLEPIVMLGNEPLLKSIVENLVDNAIKYSNDTVEVKLVQSKFIEISVKDTGIGIPTQDLPKLFTSYTRASNVGSIKGSGLGLSIVKEAVELHQGTIEVKSEVGVGTTFVVRFPCS